MAFHPNILKVVVFGPQNTGKTSLCEALAHHFNVDYVPEYSRLFAENNSVLNEDTVLPIIKGQLKLEDDYLKKANDLLVFDTNLLETKIYAHLYYNKTIPELEHLLKNRTYDLYLLPYVDIPWVNDSIRDLPNDRLEHYNLFKSVLEKNNLNFTTLNGSLNERLEQAILVINKTNIK